MNLAASVIFPQSYHVRAGNGDKSNILANSPILKISSLMMNFNGE